MSGDKLLGVEVKITLRSGTEHIGQIFTYVEDLRVVVLVSRVGNSGKEFAIVNTAQIAKVEALNTGLEVVTPELPIYYPSYANQLESRLDCSPELQRLCDEIGKTYKYLLDGVTLRLIDLGVSISPPYASVSDISGPGASRETIERVAKVVRTIQLSETRNKLHLEGRI